MSSRIWAERLLVLGMCGTSLSLLLPHKVAIYSIVTGVFLSLVAAIWLHKVDRRCDSEAKDK